MHCSHFLSAPLASWRRSCPLRCLDVELFVIVYDLENTSSNDGRITAMILSTAFADASGHSFSTTWSLLWQTSVTEARDGGSPRMKVLKYGRERFVSVFSEPLQTETVLERRVRRRKSTTNRCCHKSSTMAFVSSLDELFNVKDFAYPTGFCYST